jgi:hypothetical protein
MLRCIDSLKLKTSVFLAMATVLCLAACSDDTSSGTNDTDAHVWDPDRELIDPFDIRQVEPNHGPTNGGTEVTIRGIGFKDDCRVWFGDEMADPATVEVVDANRIVCVTPGGTVGSVAVKIQNPDSTWAEMDAGFRYDAFYVDPNAGTSNGGTFVRIVGTDTDFTPESTVTFNGNALTDANVLSPTMITGRTPAGSAGSATVRVETGDEILELEDGYQYYTGADPVNGGLGGGPIQGELSITLLDSYTNEPVEGAFVLLGASPETPYQGFTDAQGRIVFSDPDLTGPQMVSAAAPEYERVSFVAFDAREVTAFMTPFIPPEPGTFPGIAYSGVSGLIKFGGVEHSGDPCMWSQILPDPDPGFTRTIKVYQTVPDVDYAVPRPGADGIIQEGESCEGGHTYFIYTRPGSYAVYALGGMENDETGEFLPMVAGFTRSVVTAPGETANADIWIDIDLNKSVEVELQDPPPLDDLLGPTLYRTRLFLDLGGDGFMIREDHVKETLDATAAITFENVAPRVSTIADGTYAVNAEAYNFGTYPYSSVYIEDVQPDALQPLVVEDFLGIPLAVDPAPDGSPSTDRMIWEATGVSPSFQLVLIRTYPEGDPYWRIYLDGSVNAFTLPELADIDGLDGHPAGTMIWHIYAMVVPGMSFDDFSYRYLSDRYWTSDAAATYNFHFSSLGQN